ncbi:MAG TPA: hypothetical protein VM553_13950 [Dongiaceae bacterium]|nr:hypothetical protein [Dongiaceae bacterium]
MIYKIRPDLNHFQQFTLNQDEIEEKLGEDCLIFLDSRPTHYLAQWQPLSVEFFDEYPGGDREKQIPDIMPDLLGKLFVSTRAHQILKPLLIKAGEWLPVLVEGKPAYLFNPLSLAEDRQAVDIGSISRDQWGMLQGISFYEDKLVDVPLFRISADDYRHIYCQDALKQAVEQAGLKGAVFSTDFRDRPSE